MEKQTREWRSRDEGEERRGKMLIPGGREKGEETRIRRNKSEERRRKRGRICKDEEEQG